MSGSDVALRIVLVLGALTPFALSGAALVAHLRGRARWQAVLRARGAACGGPYACRFPSPSRTLIRTGARWRCPDCVTLYRLTRPWWRRDRWAPGRWVIAWRQHRPVVPDPRRAP